MYKVQIQVSAHIEDADYFRKMQNEYRDKGKYVADLFHDMIVVYKAGLPDRFS